MRGSIIFLFIIVALPLVGAEFTRKSDSLELIKFFNSTNGSEWRHKSGWATNQVVNLWYGIVIDTLFEGDNKVFVITEINLSSNKLSGTLPELDLPELEKINLAGNQISGAIPDLKSTKLKMLYFPGNKFTNELPKLNLPMLEIMDISGNNLKGELPDFNLPNVRLMNLSNNQLSGELPELNCPNLESIYLNNNKITGTIPKLNCSKLKIFNMENNELNSTIPNFNLPSLTNLNLRRNSISGSIPDLNLPELLELNLSYNQLSGEFPDLKCPKLKNIEVQNNSINGKIYLNKSPNIESLRISNNKITDLSDFNPLEKLKFFKADGNKLTFEDIEFNTFIDDFDYSKQDTIIPVIITRNGNEFTLRVNVKGDYNLFQWQLNGVNIEGANQVSYLGNENGNYRCIINNSKAPNLTLYTKIVNPIKVIYSFKSDSLELVRLFNKLNGANWKRTDNWLSENLIIHWNGITADTAVINGDSLLVVKSINLGNNNLTGNLYEFELPYLHEMNFYNNELSGLVPNFRYEKLKSLDLSNNSFSGEIPNFNLPEIISIDLSNNELSGSIPELSLPKLETFDVSGNQLSGSIPNFTFPKIDLLVLSENELSGSIPLFDMPLLTFLEITDNKLSGSISSLKIPNIRMISMENNYINGLPNFKQYSSLEGVFASNNKLTFEDIESNLSIDYFDYSEQDTILPITSKYEDGNMVLTVIANGAANKFQWQNNKNDIFKADERTLIVPYSNGDYRCVVTNLIAKELTLVSESINPALINVEDKMLEDRFFIEVFPNPAIDYINIKYNCLIFEPDIISLVDELGTEVIVQKSSKKNMGQISLNIDCLSSGNYFLKFFIGNNTQTIPVKICK